MFENRFKYFGIIKNVMNKRGEGYEK